MTETKTPGTTPSPTSAPSAGARVTVGKPENPQSVFVSMALDMSWRLAAVVLVPIVGGYELDSHIGSTPLITVIGFLLAIGGVVVVMQQTVRAAGNVSVSAKTIAPDAPAKRATTKNATAKRKQS